MDFGYNSLISSRQPLGGDLQHNTRSRFSLAGDRLQVGSVVSTNANLRLENKENTMKTLMMTICFRTGPDYAQRGFASGHHEAG